jgi:hypothetical protein
MTRRTALQLIAAAPCAALAPLEAEAWPPVDDAELLLFDSLLAGDPDPLGGCGCCCFEPPPRTPEQQQQDLRFLRELLGDKWPKVLAHREALGVSARPAGGALVRREGDAPDDRVADLGALLDDALRDRG